MLLTGLLLFVFLGGSAGVVAQTRPATGPALVVPPGLAGRTVEEVRIIEKNQALSSIVQAQIRQQVRTREGEPFDPDTVGEDYQRIYGLKKFSNVEARVEPTATGVIVVFEVTEQRQIHEIRFKGNTEIDTPTLLKAIDLQAGQAIDAFRLAQAREAIERQYREKNYTFVHVSIDQDELAKTGDVVFNIVQGPRVTVRRVQILGNHTYSDWKLKGQIHTKSYIWIFVPGTLDMDQLDQDVASIRQFYEERGFFDVRVGRKLTFSPDQSEVMVTFVINEGPRYVIDSVTFEGNTVLSDKVLRQNLKLVSGLPYDADTVKRDVREIVKVYSPLGYIYQPTAVTPNPDYLRIEPKTVFLKEPGRVRLLYQIHEGKPYRTGQIVVKGNSKTQQKVILRELRVRPGELYNSSELLSAVDRLKALNYFSNVTISPIGDDPESRDVLVEVKEAQTARFMVGAGITSNAGVLGSISFEQRNFDISNWPTSGEEFFSGKAFTGAGQQFRVLLEPGTQLTRARVDWVEPWLFDQPYSFGASGYYSQREREVYVEGRAGGRVFFGKRFSDVWSSRLTLRGEDVDISDIEKPLINRAPEILALAGHSTLTSAAIQVRRDTTDSPILPSRGTVTVAEWEHAGALGGDFDFDKFTVGFNLYTTLYEDLLDRKTILSFRLDSGYTTSETPFFEAFYGGGIGSVRGFKYRGISPRAGLDEDPIGGDFMLTGGVELSFPLISDLVRGVVFSDFGTVEPDVEIGTMRSSVGFGFRLTLPVFGQLPIALDFAVPITKDDQDDTRFFSFSLGLIQ